jgi:hypothetical protein
MRLRTILIAVAVLAVWFVGGLKAIDVLYPQQAVKAPPLAPLPALASVRGSNLVVPIVIPLTAIRDVVERAAPRTFAGKADNPIPQILQNADIGWTASRGPIAVTGAQNALSLATPLTGAVSVKGSLSGGAAGAVGDALGKLLGGNAAKQIGVNIKQFSANGDIKGTIGMSARPTPLPNWRIEPNLTAQVVLGDSAVSVAGVKLNVQGQVKPFLDKAVNDQLAGLQQRIRNDGSLERAARREWTRLCRSIPLQGVAATQGLWLEVRPVRAMAAAPKIDESAVTLTLGIQAETRIGPAQTKPECPFPAALDIVAPDTAGVSIALPIDMPIAEIGRIVDAQFAGKTFPQDGSGAAEVTVKRTTVAASGDRLLISLLVSAKEKSSWFGAGGDATVHIWAKPELDAAQQLLRMTNPEIAVESEAAFGLLGPASRVAMPLLLNVLRDRTTVDLKPFASNLQRRVGAMIAEYQDNQPGLRVAAEISSVKLTNVAFDATTLRVFAEANGLINVTVTALPGL